MVKVYYDDSVEKNALEGKTIAVVGYGSQGHQAEDGIRDDLVTGVQTCALPISV